MDSDTTLSHAELGRTIALAAPSWELREATPATEGHHAVYRVTVDTPGGTRGCYLKATPPGHERPSVALEARLLAILDRRTEIPVPEVYGAVDDHDRLPAPFLLMEAGAGETLSPRNYDSLPDASLHRIATQTGRHLAALHPLDAVDAFGSLTHAGPPVHGGRPSGELETITVVDPVTDWRNQLREWADETLVEMEETQFADIVPAAEAGLDSGIAALGGPTEPVLARVGQPFENVLVEGDDVRLLLDWESTIAATPAYDVVATIQSIAWRPSLLTPGVTDRRALVRDALLEGYRERGDRRVVEQVRTDGACYELLWKLRWMAHLEEWVPEPERPLDTVARALRREVVALL